MLRSCNSDVHSLIISSTVFPEISDGILGVMTLVICPLLAPVVEVLVAAKEVPKAVERELVPEENVGPVVKDDPPVIGDGPAVEVTGVKTFVEGGTVAGAGVEKPAANATDEDGRIPTAPWVGD